MQHASIFYKQHNKVYSLHIIKSGGTLQLAVVMGNFLPFYFYFLIFPKNSSIIKREFKKQKQKMIQIFGYGQD